MKYIIFNLQPLNKNKPQMKFNLNVSWREWLFPDLHMTPVNLIDDIQVAGQKVLEQVDGPALQSFWKDSVVCVCTGTHSDVPCLRKNTIVCKMEE